MKLVFVHGAGESSLCFYYQLRHFRNSNGIDLPGHPSGKPCDSIQGYVEWVRGYVAARRYKDVVLCGHSMGGAVAQLYALQYPEELTGLVLIGTGARLRVHPDYLKQCQDGIEDPGHWLECRKPDYSEVEADVQHALLGNAADVGPAVQLNDLLCCDRFDVMDRVGGTTVPTQIVCGSRDVMTPVKYSDYLADKIPRSMRAVIDGAGHYVQLDQYREVNRVIGGFVSGLAEG